MKDDGTSLTARIFIASIALLGLVVACAKHDQPLTEILRLEDRREAAKNFEPYLRHLNEQVQRRAAEALGKIQDPAGLPYLLPLLEHSNAETRSTAAFAIGQLGDTTAAAALLQRLAKQTEMTVSRKVLEALGKIGNQSVLPTLSKYLRDHSPELRAESALALARLAARNFRDPAIAAMLATALHDVEEEVRWTAAYALIRCGDSTVVSSLTSALSDKSPRVRMQAARALGVFGNHLLASRLSEIARHDPDWRVRVNATAALGNLPLPNLFDLLPVRDADEHVRLATLAVLGTAASRHKYVATKYDHTMSTDFFKKILAGEEQDTEAKYTWRERAAAAMALAQTIGGEAVEILAPFIRDPRPLFRARLAQALGATQDRRAFATLQKLAGDSALLVRLAALEALPQLQDEWATNIYLAALDSGDEVLTAIAMQNLAADSLLRQRHLPKMIEAYRRLKSPVDVEVAQIIFKSFALCGDASAVPILEEALRVPDRAFARAALAPLKMLTAIDYSDRLPPATVPREKWKWSDIEKLSGLTATIRTERGDIELEFFPEAAPLTVLNFVRLSERNFFDDLLIHRVVPNFVIQTGDPRGDMWGSPGYTIRAEFNARRYTRGTMGMASAGPDTEGSQFFIVHSDQPRLDGRYTIFARVTRGMEVVDGLQVGDVIEKVVIRR